MIRTDSVANSGQADRSWPGCAGPAGRSSMSVKRRSRRVRRKTRKGFGPGRTSLTATCSSSSSTANWTSGPARRCPDAWRSSSTERAVMWWWTCVRCPFLMPAVCGCGCCCVCAISYPRGEGGSGPSRAKPRRGAAVPTTHRFVGAPDLPQLGARKECGPGLHRNSPAPRTTASSLSRKRAEPPNPANSAPLGAPGIHPCETSGVTAGAPHVSAAPVASAGTVAHPAGAVPPVEGVLDPATAPHLALQAALRGISADSCVDRQFAEVLDADK